MNKKKSIYTFVFNSNCSNVYPTVIISVKFGDTHTNNIHLRYAIRNSQEINKTLLTGALLDRRIYILHSNKAKMNKGSFYFKVTIV